MTSKSKPNKTNTIKKKLLEYLKENKRNISNACEKAGISRWTFYNWCNEDPDFKEQVNEVEEYVGDIVESRLLKNIIEGRETSAIFYCKTKLKNRGYIEKHFNHSVNKEYLLTSKKYNRYWDDWMKGIGIKKKKK